MLAVTDHDSTEGLGEALAEAALHPPLEIVPGMHVRMAGDGPAEGLPEEARRECRRHAAWRDQVEPLLEADRLVERQRQRPALHRRPRRDFSQSGPVAASTNPCRRQRSPAVIACRARGGHHCPRFAAGGDRIQVLPRRLAGFDRLLALVSTRSSSIST